MHPLYSSRLASLAFLSSLLPAAGQPSLTNLGVLPNGTGSFGNAISADGLVVVGSSYGSGSRAFRWTVAGGMQNLGAVSGFTSSSSATAVSADGTVVVGISSSNNNSSRAFRWTSATGIQSLGVLGTGSASAANGVNADGTVVAGFSATSGFNGGTAFRWSAGSGMQNLNLGTGADAFGVNASGAAITGVTLEDGYSRAFLWTIADGKKELGVLADADSATAYAISSDGSAVAGFSGDQLNGTFNHAFLWTASGGMKDLGSLGGSDFAQAFALSADHSVVVGSATLAGGDRAFLWTPGEGMEDLNTYLSTAGVDLTGWTLTSARGISADGSAITGYATFNGQDRAFLVRGLSFGLPALSIRKSNGDVVVSWPSPSTGFVLEQNDDPSTPNWTRPEETVADDGTTRSITVSEASGHRFYRLAKP